MAKLKKSRPNTTTTALYNLAKKQAVSNKTGRSKAEADKSAKQAPITAMNRRSAEIKSDIKKRTTAAKEKGKMIKAEKAKELTPSKKQAQKAAIAIKYKNR